MRNPRALSIIFTSLLAGTTAMAQTVPLGCFERAYTEAHLAAHPNQGVAALRLWIGHIQQFSDEDVYFWIEAHMADQGQGARDGVAGQFLGEGGLCHVGRANCFADGDGGSFDIASVEGDTIVIETAGMRLVGDNVDAGEMSGLNEGYPGLTRYRLNRVPDTNCEET